MSIGISNKDSFPNTEVAALYAATKKETSDEALSDVGTALREDELEISQEASRKANDMQSKLEEMRSKYRTLSEELEKAREAGEGVAEAWKEKIRCLQIAMRIISGNKVPEADVKYLQEKDPELYSKSITMRVEKSDPKEHDRISEDEEEKADGEETGSDPVDMGTSDSAEVQAGTDAAAEVAEAVEAAE